MRFRGYKKQDYPQVEEILKQAELFDEIWDSEDNLSGMIDKDPEAIIVAEENEKILGNIFLIPYGIKIIYVFRLAVRKEYREKGIATALLEHVKHLSSKWGVEEVGLYVDSGNEKLQSFYQKRGFKLSKKKYFYMWNEAL